MEIIDKGYIMNVDGNDYLVIDSLIKEKKKYLFLKGIDSEENLLDTQIIARLVIDEDNDYALEDIDDRFLMETLRNEFANRLREEYM